MYKCILCCILTFDRAIRDLLSRMHLCKQPYLSSRMHLCKQPENMQYMGVSSSPGLTTGNTLVLHLCKKILNIYIYIYIYVCVYVYIYMYIYIYMYAHIYMCICQHFNVNTYLIKHYRHFFLHILLFILSTCYIEFMISGGNWLLNLP